MEKLGVHWDVARVGEYKTATEQLTRSDMSPAERETLDAYLDAQVTHYEKAVEAGRKLTPEKLRAAWAEGILSSQPGAGGGAAGRRGVRDGAGRARRGVVPRARFHPTYSPRDEREDRWGLRRRIAVVPVMGDITGGKSREDPLGFARIAGAETVVRALRAGPGGPVRGGHRPARGLRRRRRAGVGPDVPRGAGGEEAQARHRLHGRRGGLRRLLRGGGRG